jgi:hypothetical protein
MTSFSFDIQFSTIPTSYLYALLEAIKSKRTKNERHADNVVVHVDRCLAVIVESNLTVGILPLDWCVVVSLERTLYTTSCCCCTKSYNPSGKGPADRPWWWMLAEDRI